MTSIALNFLRFWTAIFMLAGVGVQALAAGGESHTFAVIPGAPPATISKRWTPMIEQLSRETGIDFKLKYFERMPDFERDIWSGVPDFIYASPIQTVVAHQGAGYIPLVRSSVLAEIKLYVRQDSPIASVGELRGKTISFVGNKNVCSVFMQHQLASYGKDFKFEREYAGSTRNVILNILMGKTDAGSAFASEVEREPVETRMQLREVATTPKFAAHPVSAHPRVPVAVRAAVQKALLKISASAGGPALLQPLRLDNLIEADYDRDYRHLETVEIKKLTNWGE